MDFFVAVTLKQLHVPFFFFDDLLKLATHRLIGHERADHHYPNV